MKFRIIFSFLVPFSTGLPACPPPVDMQAAVVGSSAEAISAAKAGWRSINEKASWQKVYSPENVDRGDPYTAVLDGGEWRVASGNSNPAVHVTPKAVVCQADGKVSASD